MKHLTGTKSHFHFFKIPLASIHLPGYQVSAFDTKLRLMSRNLSIYVRVQTLRGEKASSFEVAFVRNLQGESSEIKSYLSIARITILNAESARCFLGTESTESTKSALSHCWSTTSLRGLLLSNDSVHLGCLYGDGRYLDENLVPLRVFIQLR